MNNKIIIKKVNKYVSEAKDTVIYSLKGDKKQRILIKGGMGIGKSSLITYLAKNVFNEGNLGSIFVLPSVLQGNQLNKRNHEVWTACNGTTKGFLDWYNQDTTPDSLLKPVKHFEEIGRDFILIVDESHEEIQSVLFRSAFNNIEKAFNSKHCKGAIYLSATTEVVELSSLDKFDKFIQIESDNPLKNSEEIEIVPLKEMTIENIVNTIVQELKRSPKVSFKIDDIVKGKEVTKMLNELGYNFTFISSKQGTKTTNNSFLSEEDYWKSISGDCVELEAFKYDEKQGEKAEKVLNKILNDLPVEENLGCTSVINSGTEIQNDPNLTLINFITRTYTRNNEVQVVGRFRKSVKKYVLAFVPTVKEEEQQEEFTRREFKNIKEGYLSRAKLGEDTLNRIKKDNISMTEEELKQLQTIFTGVVYEDEKECYTTNENIINAISWKEYVEQDLRTPNTLLGAMEHEAKRKEIFYDRISIRNEEIEINEEVSNKVKQNNENKQKAQEELKEIEKAFKEEILKVDDEIIKRIVTNDINEDEEISLDIQILNSNYKLLEEQLKAFNRKINTLEACGIPKVESVKLYSTLASKEIDHIKEINEGIKYNLLYKTDKEAFKRLTTVGSPKDKAKAELNYKVRVAVEKWGRGHRITEKDMSTILLYMSHSKFKIFEKEPFYIEADNKKKLNPKLKVFGLSYLETICNIRQDNKGHKIGKIQTNINDIIDKYTQKQ